MTIQELNTRQGWTLSQKIDHAVGTVEAFLSRTGKVPYVSFSGGKDSTVLLDIVRRFVDRDIKAVFCNTGNEYPEIVRFVRSTENVTIREALRAIGVQLPDETPRLFTSKDFQKTK